MKKTLLTMIAATLCLMSCTTSENNKEEIIDTVTIHEKTTIDTFKGKDTVPVKPVKKKTDDEKADESLDRIMKNRKNVQ
uniref:hypothetical protein n=1 Tax=Pedobacter sp. TaxID=1411316 RepID=UPI0015EEAA87|nr:hypothetical protein [Pedobacter sp.]